MGQLFYLGIFSFEESEMVSTTTWFLLTGVCDPLLASYSFKEADDLADGLHASTA